MNTLFINACVREDSRTLSLAYHLLKYIDGDVTHLELSELGLSPLTRDRLNERDTALHNGNFDASILRLARQFADADTIVIAAPFWDLSIPTLLKCYIENITAAGVTFDYADNGYRGLCKAKKLYFVTTSGGPRCPDFGYSYVSTLAKEFYGIPETVCYAAECLDMGGDVDAILAKTIEEIDRNEGK